MTNVQFEFVRFTVAFGYRSPSSSANLLSSGNVAAAGSTSPGQGRSLRDYDEKLHALQKENFNLKLRLFFLEEKSTTTVGGGGSNKTNDDDSLFKQNVDLKVKSITIADHGRPIFNIKIIAGGNWRASQRTTRETRSPVPSRKSNGTDGGVTT